LRGLLREIFRDS